MFLEVGPDKLALFDPETSFRASENSGSIQGGKIRGRGRLGYELQVLKDKAEQYAKQKLTHVALVLGQGHMRHYDIEGRLILHSESQISPELLEALHRLIVAEAGKVLVDQWPFRLETIETAHVTSLGSQTIEPGIFLKEAYFKAKLTTCPQMAVVNFVSLCNDAQLYVTDVLEDTVMPKNPFQKRMDTWLQDLDLARRVQDISVRVESSI